MNTWQVISFSKRRPPMILRTYKSYWWAVLAAVFQQFFHPFEYIDIVERLP